MFTFSSKYIQDNLYSTEETFTLERKAIIPIAYTLHQNYPNPFNPITSLRCDLPEQAQVTLTIYDLIGREVAQLVNTTQDAGYRSVQWNATNMHGKPVSAGVSSTRFVLVSLSRPGKWCC